MLCAWDILYICITENTEWPELQPIKLSILSTNLSRSINRYQQKNTFYPTFLYLRLTFSDEYKPSPAKQQSNKVDLYQA